jgi:hypothetical protein
MRSVLDGAAGLVSGGIFERSRERFEPTEDPLLLRRLRREDGECAGEVGDAIMMDICVTGCWRKR